MKKEIKLVNKVKCLLRKIGCPRWLHHFGPKKYELLDHCFALLCKQLWQLSYRRIASILAMLDIKCPSKSALQYNAKRIPFALWQKLLRATTQPIHIAAIDSTGMTRNIVSYHYLWRIDRDKPSAKPLKLSLAVDTAKKTVTAARIKTSFWSNDVKDMPYLINNMKYVPKLIVADKAYDSEKLHEYAYDRGIRAVIPLKKNAKRGFYRLKNAKKFRLRTYHRREIVESVISALKRKFGSYVRSRKIQTQRTEIFCRLILHNIFLCLYRLLGQSLKNQKLYKGTLFNRI
jgi:transposase